MRAWVFGNKQSGSPHEHNLANAGRSRAPRAHLDGVRAESTHLGKTLTPRSPTESPPTAQTLHPKGPREATITGVDPDPLALREDLSHAMDLLALDVPPVGYLKRFLIGLSRGIKDSALEAVALGMNDTLGPPDRAELRKLLSGRIQAMPDAV